MKNKKEKLVVILLVIGLILMTSVISFAAFRFTGIGSTINQITTGSITMSYTESSNVISMTGALPTTDATGTKRLNEGEYFDFTVSSSITGNVNINFEVAAQELDGNTIDGKYIKYYLTKINEDGSEEELMSPKVYTAETTENQYTGRPSNMMSLYTGSMSSTTTTNYRLRLYVDESYNPQGDGGNLIYKTRVNVYGLAGEKVSEETSEEAFAVYSADDNSLNFYKRSVPTVGDTLEGKTVTAIYTGIEDNAYDPSTLPWFADYASSITSVSVVDEISPISTAYWFMALENCSTLELENLDTSQVTAMSNMFDSVGYNVETVNLDLSNLNVSNVTTMQSMFANVGGDATTVNLNLSNWDTSSLKRISAMFNNAGENATSFTITGMDSWNTSGITNMNSVFDNAGCNAPTFNIGDISSWDTSSATMMLNMFRNAGVAADWTLDLSGWNVSNVANYSNFNSGVESKVIAPTWVN